MFSLSRKSQLLKLMGTLPNERKSASYVFSPRQFRKPDLSEESTPFETENELSKHLESHAGPPPNIALAGQFGSMPLNLDGSKSKHGKFNRIHVAHETRSHRLVNIQANRIDLAGCNIYLRKVSCRSLTLRVRAGEIKIEDCTIGCLLLIFPENEVECNIAIQNCIVGSFWINSEPKVRDIIISGTHFFRSPLSRDDTKKAAMDDYRPPNKASFSLLHKWAREAGNTEIAHIARGEGLALEHGEASGFDRFIYLLWGVFSEYGLSPARPIAFLLSSFIVLSLALFITGTSTPSNIELVGWREILEDDARYSTDDFYRAIIGAGESALSPLSALGLRSLVVPDHLWVTALKIAQGYFSIAMLVLSGFAIRRRLRFAP